MSNTEQTTEIITNINDEFIIGALHNGVDKPLRLSQELGLNVWHSMIHSEKINDRHTPRGWFHTADEDKLSTEFSSFIDPVNQQIRNAAQHGMKVILYRPKIEYLSFGQRSDYQCEEIHSNPDLWFYTFGNNTPGRNYSAKTVTDNSSFGRGITVRQCTVPSQPGYVVDRLRANTEQCNNDAGSTAWRGDSETDWHIKPRIRIDRNFANEQANSEKLICRIDIKDQNDNLLKSVNLKTRNFISAGGYNGSYLEEFNFAQGDDNLILRGAWGDRYFHAARGRAQENTVQNKADIQVYWYGNCDMWIDYIRVDNDIAHNLLGTGDKHDEYMKWLEWEAQLASDNKNNIISFFIELFEFNHIPCMTYVSRTLDSIYGRMNPGSNISLMSVPTMLMYSAHVPWSERLSLTNSGHMVRNYLAPIGTKEFYAASYPLNSIVHDSTWSRVPNSLPDISSPYLLSHPVSPAAYDKWLQIHLDSMPYKYESGAVETGHDIHDRGNFTFIMKLGNKISKELNIPMIYYGPAHLFYQPRFETHREPTNEEFDMLANVSVSYGSRGILYFMYPSEGEASPQNYFTRGFVEFDNGQFQVPRFMNIYGQKKWEFVQNMFRRLKKWSPYVLSFDHDKTFSYIYRLSEERDALSRNSFYRTFVTYISGAGTPSCSNDFPTQDHPAGMKFECRDDRYLQVATFAAPGSPNDKYLMVVNRRCAPYINDSNDDNKGGRRFIRFWITANHNELGNFSNWSIDELSTETDTPVNFRSDRTTGIDLGWFMPGEGKLYKISPVN